MRINISFKKDTEKVVLLQEMIKLIVKFCHTFLWGARVTSKVLTSHTQKLRFRISDSFRPEIIFIWNSSFYRYEHFYTYNRREFQNSLKGKLCSCFGQLLHVERNVDSTQCSMHTLEAPLTLKQFQWINFSF